MSQHKVAENRKLERLTLYIKVFDNETNSLLGHTANIHTDGMMLVTRRQLALDKDYNLRLEHVRDDFKKISISLFAKGVWNKTSHNSDDYNIGFQFYDLSHSDSIAIVELIDELTG